MIEILDKNGFDELIICNPQIGSGTIKVAHNFAILFDQTSIVCGQVLYYDDKYLIMG